MKRLPRALRLACFLLFPFALVGCVGGDASTTSTSGSHPYGTPTHYGSQYKWSPIDRVPEETLRDLTADVTRLGLHVLVPSTLGPVADPTVEAKAWTYWMTVSGDRGADLMLIRPRGETQHLTLHVTTLLALGRENDFEQISIRGQQGQRWTEPPFGYPFPQTVFSWVEDDLRFTVSVNDCAGRPSGCA